MKFIKDNKDLNTKDLNEVLSLSKRILKILYIVFIAVLVLAGIIAFQKLNILNIILEFLAVVSPFFIGFFIAWYLRPLVLKLSKKVHSETLSAVLVFSGFVLIIFVLLYTFIPTVYNEVNELVGLLPGFVEKATTGVKEFFVKFESNGVPLGDFPEKLLATITNYGAEVASSLPNTIINIIIINPKYIK